MVIFHDLAMMISLLVVHAAINGLEVLVRNIAITIDIAQ